ncbi:MAG TPA: hypothetical protein ENH90_01745 [bacterium]|nr:hypothetical protein [bacterium]
MIDPFKRIILLALQKTRRPLSTSEVAKKTRMDWATAKAKLASLHRKGKVNSKKVAIRKVGFTEKRVPSKILWSTRKIK